MADIARGIADRGLLGRGTSDRGPADRGLTDRATISKGVTGAVQAAVAGAPVTAPVPIVRPIPAAARIARLTDLVVKQAVAQIDGGASGKRLLSTAIAIASQPVRALQLQQIVRKSYGNYYWALFVMMQKGGYTGAAVAIAKLLAKRGIAANPDSGHFRSLANLDPTKPPASRRDSRGSPRWVDSFVKVTYALNYRPRLRGRLSEVLQLTYADGARLDLDIRLISDNVDRAWAHAIADSYVGPAARVFPSRMSRNLTPRLWWAKHQVALRAMNVTNTQFGNLLFIGTQGLLAAAMAATPVAPRPVPQATSFRVRPTVARPKAPQPPPGKQLGPGDEFAAHINGDRGVMAELGKDGFLDLYIVAGPTTPSGGQMFNEALRAYGNNVKGIRGNWNGGGSLSSNFDTFVAAVQGAKPFTRLHTPAQAAFETFTGKMARRAGFSKVRIIKNDIPGNKVVVEFFR